MPAFKFCGFNFNEIIKEGDEKVAEFKEISTINKISMISAGPYFEIRAFNDEFEVISSLTNDQDNQIKLSSKIKQFLIANEVAYFLLENEKVFSYNFSSKALDCISTNDKINFISCTNALYGFSNQKIYQLLPQSKLLYEFKSHQRIKKVSSGLEHTVILTSNGDLYSFGCGLRGQLGHGDVRSQELPLLIEALAGIKIIDLSCGAFHTVVISSFGDVYSFGWNFGQLGIKKAPQSKFEKDNGKMRCQQVFTLPQSIEFEDESEPFKNVYCGHKHTILRTDSSRLFAAGLNNYGQLGLSSNAKDFDKFTEIPVKITQNEKVSCGYHSTYIFNDQN